MQEGTLALMQLAKTMAALERLRAACVPYVSVMSDPTTGGVFASYAVMGDINLAGRRPDRVRREPAWVPARSVRSCRRASSVPSSCSATGSSDRIVPRSDLRRELARVLRFLVPARQEAVRG